MAAGQKAAKLRADAMRAGGAEGQALWSQARRSCLCEAVHFVLVSAAVLVFCSAASGPAGTIDCTATAGVAMIILNVCCWSFDVLQALQLDDLATNEVLDRSRVVAATCIGAGDRRLEGRKFCVCLLGATLFRLFVNLWSFAMNHGMRMLVGCIHRTQGVKPVLAVSQVCLSGNLPTQAYENSAETFCCYQSSITPAGLLSRCLQMRRRKPPSRTAWYPSCSKSSRWCWSETRGSCRPQYAAATRQSWASVCRFTTG